MKDSKYTANDLLFSQAHSQEGIKSKLFKMVSLTVNQVRLANRLLKKRENEISEGKLLGVYSDHVRFTELAEDFLTGYRVNRKQISKVTALSFPCTKQKKYDKKFQKKWNKACKDAEIRKPVIS